MGQGRNRSIVEAQAVPLVQEVVEVAQRQLQEEFEEHAVTQELDAGIHADNLSGTLDGSYGNLFSYIGFKRGDHPTEVIRRELSKKSKVKVNFTGGRFKISMLGPSRDKIYSKTPLPWASDSWARRIEVGIAGFGRYLLKNSASSRSGIAIQTEKQIRGGRFRNVSYLTKMFRRFYAQLGVKR
jgi:hypothetical protein